jgi:hypothetical protein
MIYLLEESAIGLLGVRQQLCEATDIALIHETAAPRAQMAFCLRGFMAEVMASAGGIPLETIRSLAKTLRGGPVGLQLGHDIQLLIVWLKLARACLAPIAGRSQNIRLLADRIAARFEGR